jgi:stage II sporulation protein AB (anti-sigma F factor)
MVRLSASLTSELLEIVVEDDGKGIPDLEQAMLPGKGSDPERLGLGFVFMKSFMDEVEVRTEVGKGTSVKLLKSLPVNGNTGKSVKN